MRSVAFDAAETRRLLAVVSNFREVMVRAALSRARQERWDEALVFSSRALRAEVLDVNLWIAQMAALTRTGTCAEAQQWANTMAATDPWQPSQKVAALKITGRGEGGSGRW